MAWLSDWAKRIEITVDNTNIDSDLTHFPVPIIISATSGQSDDDLTVIFDDLEDNSLKIAVTKSDGTTQIYVEVEKWDDTAEEAVLWVSKSDLTLTSASTTTLYIYYDSTQSDNTTYVAGVGSRTEVWDSNYKMVLHMADASAGVTDSTSNNNDTVSEGGDPTYQQAGKIGYGISFDGNDYFLINDSADFTTTDHTIEVVAKASAADALRYLFSQLDANDGYFIIQSSTGSGVWEYYTYVNAVGPPCTSANPPDTNNTEYLAGVRDSGDMTLYIDAVAEADTETNSGEIDSGDNITIGADHQNPPQNGFVGTIEEVRFSDSARSAAWVKATQYSFDDDLLEFGVVEEAQNIPLATYAFTGYAPTIVVDQIVNVPAGTLAFTGYAPTAKLIHTVAVPLGTYEFTGYAPLIGDEDLLFRSADGSTLHGRVVDGDGAIAICIGNEWFLYKLTAED